MGKACANALSRGRTSQLQSVAVFDILGRADSR